MKVERLRCEYQENPKGIDSLSPRFSWNLVSDRRNVMIDGKPVREMEGVFDCREQDDGVVVELGSGHYSLVF